MSKQLEAFYRDNPDRGGGLDAFDTWLDGRERVYTKELQRLVGAAEDGWCGPGTVAKTRAALASRHPAIAEALASVGPRAYFTERVQVPAPSGQVPSPCRQSTMLGLFGPPRTGTPPVDCTPLSNDRVLVTTSSVGPFRVTGMVQAVESLQEILDKVLIAEPELHALLGTAGMLCCRAVRGGTNWSNHSWGTAVDIKIDGRLDPPGDGKCQRGLMILASGFFEPAGWAWGGRFGNEDAMHFEVSDELIRSWRDKGLV